MFLDEILDSTRRGSRERAARRSLRQLEHDASRAEPPRGFARALAGAAGGLGLIAELKKASPSAGLMRTDFDLPGLAAAYARGGADALSVLTEGPHFQGGLDDLARAADAALPRLQKDFLLSEYQVLEGRAAGADAVLLVCEALPPARVWELARLGIDLGMDVLLEGHDPANLRHAATLAERAPDRLLVGINNRDLRTSEVSLESGLRSLRDLPRGLMLVAESGIRTPEEALRLRAAGARGILVGESLLRAADVEAATRQLLSGVRGADGGSEGAS